MSGNSIPEIPDNSIELRPCPFCGKPAQVIVYARPFEGGNEIRFYCDNPSCWIENRTTLLPAWNTLPVEDALRAEIARLWQENDQRKAELDYAQPELERLRAELSDLRADYQLVSITLDQTRAELADEKNERRKLDEIMEAQTSTIFASASWHSVTRSPNIAVGQSVAG